MRRRITACICVRVADKEAFEQAAIGRRLALELTQPHIVGARYVGLLLEGTEILAQRILARRGNLGFLLQPLDNLERLVAQLTVEILELTVDRDDARVIVEIDGGQFGPGAGELNLLFTQPLDQRRTQHVGRGIDRSGGLEQFADRGRLGLGLGPGSRCKDDLGIQRGQLFVVEFGLGAAEDAGFGAKALNGAFRVDDLAAQVVNLRGQPVPRLVRRLVHGLAGEQDVVFGNPVGDIRGQLRIPGLELHGDDGRPRHLKCRQLVEVVVYDPLVLRHGGWIRLQTEGDHQPPHLPDAGLQRIELRHLIELEVLYRLHGKVAGQHDLYAAGLLQPLGRQALRIAALMSALLMVTMAVIFLGKLGDNYSRVWLVGFFALSIILLIASHAAMRAQMHYWHRQGRLSTRVVIVGGGEPAAQLISSLHASNNSFVEIVGLFDDRNDDRSPQAVGRLPKLGNIQELVDFTRTYGVDMLVISLPVAAESRLLQIMKQLWVLPVDIRLSAHSQRLRYRPRAYSWIGNVPMIDVFDQPLRDWGRLLKTIEDKVIASIALMLLSPVMLAVAIAIRLESKGPVLFRQQRYGFNNQPIEVLKFRSMYTDMCDARANKLVTRDDPRVTRVGRFIRKTSLDELPQLINVLRGDLSLVGPRPHAHHAKAADRLYDDVVDGYFARHKVKPGITGWAQINGWRGETDTEDKIRRRVEFDLYYIENWSLLFDLKILAMTPFALLKSENAY